MKLNAKKTRGTKPEADLRASIWNTSFMFFTMIVLTILMLIAAKKLITGSAHPADSNFEIHASK